MMWLEILGAGVSGYAFGSIPFGLLLTRAAGAGDIRAIGSGNIGATNVLRTGRKGLAAATLLLDLAKGWGAVALAQHLWPAWVLPAAAAVVFGHCYPLWLGFNGGKGVATLMGVVLGLCAPAALVYALVWILLLAAVRISSVAGMSAAVSAPVAVALFGTRDAALLLAVLAALVLWKHRANLRRLASGSEPRIGAGRG